MVFSGTTFLFLFLPLLLLLYFCRKSIGWRNAILLIFSLLFYAWGEPLYVFLMLLSLAVNYALARLVARAKEEGRNAGRLMLADALFNVLLIGIFKYAGFFVGTLDLIPGV